MLNKKVLKIPIMLLLIISLVVTYIPMTSYNVLAEEPQEQEEADYIGEEVGQDQEEIEGTDENVEEADPINYEETVTVRFIVDGVPSVEVADLATGTRDPNTGEYVTDSLTFNTISSNSSITAGKAAQFYIKPIPGKSIAISVDDNQEDATNGPFVESGIGNAGEFAIQSDDPTIVYIKTTSNIEDEDNMFTGEGEGLVWNIENKSENAPAQIYPGKEKKLSDIYTVGKTYYGKAVSVNTHFGYPGGTSTATMKHTSGILAKFGKNITAACCSGHSAGLGVSGTYYKYSAKCISINDKTGQIKWSIKYRPTKGANCHWLGLSGRTTVYKSKSNVQSHSYTGKFDFSTPKGYMQVTKKSKGNVSNGNDMYSVSGAKYQVFHDAECTKAAAWSNGKTAVMTTDADGTDKHQIEIGTYYVKEIEAPKGHAKSGEIKKVKVNKKNKSNKPVKFTYTNKERYGQLLIEKIDSETGKFLSEGDAQIETVKFKVEYFDNLNASGSATRSWVFKIDKEANNNKILTEDMLVSGTPYKINGNMVFPLGSYKITEITPVGYIDNVDTYTLKLTDSLGKTSTKTYVGRAELKQVPNQVIRGGLEVEKRDLETGAQWPLGGASFVGTEFELINASKHFIYYYKDGNFIMDGDKKKEFAPGAVIDTMKITSDGVPATTDSDGDGKDYSLPYGTYKLKEIAVDDKEQKHGSYLPTEIDKGTEITIYVNEHGKVHTTKDQPKTNQTKVESQDAFYNQVKRSDAQIKKIIEDNKVSTIKKGIPFVIKSKTTKEAHVIVVSDNSGYASTTSSFNPHTISTNANDYMINTDGTPKLDSNNMVDTSKIDYYAGVWWSKDSLGNETKKVDDNLGALPYDTYEIYELPCEQNKDFGLIKETFEIARDSSSVKEILLTIENHPSNIGTSAKDPSTKTNIGTNESDSIIDTIKYWGFEAGKYHVITTLMDKETEKPIQIEGKDLVVEKDVEFTHGEGTVDVEIAFPKGALKGKNVVVFEEVYRLDEDGKPITETNGKPYGEHKDINDEGQTIHYPDIKTTATDKIDGDHDVLASGTQTIVDVVEYKNVSPNKEYTMKGVLMDKETGKPLLDKDQKEITAEKTFTAEQSSGTVELEFTFDASLLAGKTLVAFEDLEYEGKKIATHADINDHNQSVYIPKIKTKFMTNDGEKDIDFSQENVVLVDNVEYKNLIPGEIYEATVNIATKDGELLKDDSNNPYEGKETFTAEAADGTYQVKLPEIPVSKITQDIVAFETLKSIPNAPTPGEETPTKEPKIVAEHKDVNDKDQTIRIPKIGTSAKDQADGDKAILGKPDQTLVDTISYDGLIPGEEYIAKGQLANPKTGELLKDESGNEITSETKFTPSAEKGTVEVQIKFDARDYMAGSVVVFEEIYRVPKDNTKPQRYVGWHKDTKDTNQTLDVYMELYVTIAKADADKVKYFLKGAEITVFDGEGNIAKDKNGKECVGITDEKGEVKFTVLYLEGMKFYAQETKAPKGYQINKEKFEVKPETLDEEGADILISILDKALVIPPMGPKTGDTTKILIYLLLALIGTTSVIAVRRKLKK